MKLRIIRNATILVELADDDVVAYVADKCFVRTCSYTPIDDEQQSKIEAAIERGADEVEV